jgi:hypothetical protein
MQYALYEFVTIRLRPIITVANKASGAAYDFAIVRYGELIPEGGDAGLVFVLGRLAHWTFIPRYLSRVDGTEYARKTEFLEWEDGVVNLLRRGGNNDVERCVVLGEFGKKRMEKYSIGFS